MVEHTPGPWSVEPDDRPNMEWNNHIAAGEYMRICFMSHYPSRQDEMEANAHLIAAAPDLLAACKAMFEWTKSRTDIHPADAWEMARKAIAKATKATQ